MSLPDRTTVLIVGAGPVGLATALSLLYRGFHDFIIVEAVSQRQNVSRAIVVHPPTLEALDTVGCGNDITSQGIKYTSFNIGTRAAELIRPDVNSLKAYTRYPYTLLVTQNVVERILENKLTSFGVTVHRPVKAVGLRRNTGDTRTSDVTFEDGRVITANYVIGADGARSAIRTLAGIGFTDPSTGVTEEDTNVSQMLLADVTFDATSADDPAAQNATLSPNGFFLCLPLPYSYNESIATGGQAPLSTNIYRIICAVPLEEGEVPRSPSKEYVQNLVDRFGPYPLSSNLYVNPKSKPTPIKDIVWSSRFRHRAATADTTFSRLGSSREGSLARTDEADEGGAILLIGDAAHIHSPAGGQGMNLGLRDAIFLGEALTKHIRVSESESLSTADAILREFASARHERALEVIQLTKSILSVAGMKHRARLFWWFPFDSATVRACVLWVMGSIPFVRGRMAWQMSGLGRR